jgi:hypothetical protein
MLIHIVCWKYKPDIADATREEHRQKLIALTESIPEIETLDVGGDVLHLDRSFDTGLVATFVDEAALNEYTIHPQHQEVAAFGREIAEKVISVDFYRNP